MPERMEPAKYTRKTRRFLITTRSVEGEVHVDARGRICKVPFFWKNFDRQTLFALTGWLRNNGMTIIKELED